LEVSAARGLCGGAYVACRTRDAWRLKDSSLPPLCGAGARRVKCDIPRRVSPPSRCCGLARRLALTGDGRGAGVAAKNLSSRRRRRATLWRTGGALCAAAGKRQHLRRRDAFASRLFIPSGVSAPALLRRARCLLSCFMPLFSADFAVWLAAARAHHMKHPPASLANGRRAALFPAFRRNLGVGRIAAVNTTRRGE